MRKNNILTKIFYHIILMVVVIKSINSIIISKNFKLFENKFDYLIIALYSIFIIILLFNFSRAEKKES